MFTESDATMIDFPVGEGNERQSGRTTAMLNVCIDAVLEGQPKCVVIAHTHADAHRLQKEFVHQLRLKKPFDHLDCRYLVVYYEGSEIRFITIDDHQHFVRTRFGFGEFWDHRAEEVIEESLSKLLS